MSEPDLTVVMPALNEEENIQAAIQSTLTGFGNFGITGELVVVNDGSTDRTGALVQEAAQRDSRIRLLQHETPQGIGASFWDGVTNARGECVCLLPGDNENEPGEIFRYFCLMDHVDLVVPFVFNKNTRSWFRNVLSSCYRFIIKTTFRVPFHYTNGTVIYRRSVLQALEFHSSSFFFQTDILVRLARRGYLFAEVPYRLRARGHGVSKAVSFRSLLKVMKGYFRLLWDVGPFRRASVTGFPPGSRSEQRYREASLLSE